MRMNKSKQNSELHFIDSQPPPRRAAWSTKTAAIVNETNNDSDRHMSALLPTLANEKHKGET